jgi:hypothetical protein
MANQVGSAGKSLMAEFRYRMQMAEHGISDGNGRGRKIRFIHGALQKCSSGQNGLTRAGTRG